MKKPSDFQRAAAAPHLPNRTGQFILYCLRHFQGWMILMIIMETGQAIGHIMVPYAIKTLMDSVAKLTQTTDLQSLHTPFLLLLGLTVAEIIFSRASGAILVSVGPKIRQRTAHNLYTYMQYHAPHYFSQHFSGALAHRISDTAMSVNHTVWAIWCDFWPITITFLVSISLLVQTHQQLGLFVACWVLVYVSISYWLATRCQAYAQHYADTRSMVNGKIVDAVTNIVNTKLFARLDFERDNLKQYLDTEVSAGQRTFWYMEKVRWFQFIAAATLKIGMLYYAVNLWIAGSISVGDFAMCAGLVLIIIGDARNLSRHFLEFFEYLGTIANGVSSIVQPHEIIDKPTAKPLLVSAGRICFERVGFAYPQQPPLFKELSVVIEPGQRVGLVGSSGSGKSTFVNLILRSIEPQHGQITIDGMDIQQVLLDSLHEQISLIPQEPSLFHRSLEDNIRYGQLGATSSAIKEAAQLANADQFIKAMPEGYASLVGERGVKLSGGQRQRIAIARVLLKNAPILILDEATASLDSITEKTIQDNLDRAMGCKTVIVIAHRLATIAHLDRILVFNHGAISEDGSHAELMALKGLYFRMWSMQAGGFLADEDELEAKL
jgi:ATP-binding cassette subfamily B protein